MQMLQPSNDKEKDSITPYIIFTTPQHNTINN